MINIKTEYLKKYCINKLQDALETVAGEYKIKIENIDDLHDYTIETCPIDSVYYAMYSMLPLILEECINYIDDEQDYYDSWREHCDSDFYGI